MRHTLPPGWEEKTLGEVCEIERGGSPRPIKSYLTTAPNGLNWIKIGDTSPNSKYIYSVKEKIRPEGLAKSRWVQEGDFLLSNSMSFGRPYILKTNGCIHDGWLVLKQYQSNLQCDFLYYLLSSPFVQKQFQQSAQGSTVRNLNTQRVAKIIIPIPPLLEQKRIVEKLDKIFAAIDKAKSQTEKNLQNAKDVFSSYLNNIFNHPAHSWKEKTLGEVCEIISGTTPDTKCPQYWGGENYWITPAELTEGKIFIDSCRRKITDLAVRDCSLRPMPKGTVVFSSRAPIGKVAINNLEVLYCNQGFKNFICSQSLDNKFLFYFLKFNTPLLVSLGHGTTFKEISKTTISKVSIRYPSLLEEQKQIVKKLDILKSKTQELEKIYTQKLADLEELKQSVLQQAFNGKL